MTDSVTRPRAGVTTDGMSERSSDAMASQRHGEQGEPVTPSAISGHETPPDGQLGLEEMVRRVVDITVSPETFWRELEQKNQDAIDRLQQRLMANPAVYVKASGAAASVREPLSPFDDLIAESTAAFEEGDFERAREAQRMLDACNGRINAGDYVRWENPNAPLRPTWIEGEVLSVSDDQQGMRLRINAGPGWKVGNEVGVGIPHGATVRKIVRPPVIDERCGEVVGYTAGLVGITRPRCHGDAHVDGCPLFVRSRKHAFIRGAESGPERLGPPDETCAVCQCDPRNSVHEVPPTKLPAVEQLNADLGPYSSGAEIPNALRGMGWYVAWDDEPFRGVDRSAFPERFGSRKVCGCFAAHICDDHALDVEYDGVTLRTLLKIDQESRQEVRTPRNWGHTWTPAQRAAVSAHWSAELRARLAAAKVKEQQRVVLDIDPEDL